MTSTLAPQATSTRAQETTTTTTPRALQPQDATQSPPSSTIPPPAPSTTTTIAIVRCADLAARGAAFEEAVRYWLEIGAPARMDADGDGIPCETVYPSSDVGEALAGLSPTTSGEPYPAALSRDLVPWPQVGPGWYLATFRGSIDVGMSSEDLIRRPTVLYLIHHDGRIYELDNWSGDVHRQLMDWSPDGRLVLTVTHQGSGDDWKATAEVIDIKIGSIAVLAEGSRAENRDYEFTRPTGRNIVERHNNWSEEATTITRLQRTGSAIATVASQAETSWRYLDYLYLTDGTGLILARSDGLVVVSNTGTWLRDLWSPPSMWCTPTAWHPDGTFSASCYSDDADVLPHEHFSESWLIPVDGTPGSPVTHLLTENTRTSEDVGQNYGYIGAWPVADGTVVQGSGDCSTAWIVTVGADGDIVGTIPGNLVIGIHDEVAVVKTWEDCGGISGAIHAYSIADERLLPLITAAEDIGGIQDVLSLAEPQH